MDQSNENNSLQAASATPGNRTETKTIDRDHLLACIDTVEALVANRGLMAQLSEDERKRMLMATGQLSRPDRIALVKLTKSLRKQKRVKAQAHDREVKDASAIRMARTHTVFSAPAQIGAESRAGASSILSQPQSCYVCKAEYRQLHFFYDSMCGDCGELNYAKRFQTANLTGRVALITGSRVKIGYQAALLMLRAGAQVIVTTRFPVDSAKRYSQEMDFADWKDRLQIFGLDLRHAPSVEIFSRYVSERYDRLDFLLNNAAQTVRRPRTFYAHLIADEAAGPGSRDAQALLAAYEDCRDRLDRQLLPSGEAGLLAYTQGGKALAAPGLSASAEMSQMSLLPDDLSCGVEMFPEGRFDADLQQVDLRTTNSWRMRLADVPTAELLEIQLINAVAPFILCSKLKPLMLRHPSNDKHIVNVSAMEGKFTRYTKTDKHPHTNMAKAALNMMTQTSAPDYVKSGIHMNAVDTGWVTDEDPIAHATRKKDELGFQPPLDIVDGAARICDPILHGLNTGEHVWGKFLKDYKPTAW